MYHCPGEYVPLLYRKAYEKTHDAQFLPPPPGSIWDPIPSRPLRALGLEVRTGYCMMFEGRQALFQYYADDRGHEEFLALNRSLGIPVRQVDPHKTGNHSQP